jgi:DNA invertase Pin-like site-specific DNA recombinase
MTGQRIGYIRVSSDDQNEGRQLEGIDLDQRFVDKASGSTTERPQLQACLAYCRKGDTLAIHSMDRLARNLDDLRRLVAELTAKGVQVQFLKEGLSFTGDDNAMSKLLLSMMGAFAEFERSIIRERQREGIALAKAKGVYKGALPKLSPSEADALREQHALGIPKSVLARRFGISRPAVYNYLKEKK